MYLNVLIVAFLVLLEIDILVAHSQSSDKYHVNVNLQKKRVSTNQNIENDADFWRTGAQIKLREQLLRRHNTNIARNVIMFLGDGMSIPTLAAARMYLGQKQRNTGEESHLTFETFPYVGLSKTYCIDKQVADSACSATAYLCGIKANYGTIGVNGRVNLNDCLTSQNPNNRPDSIATWAQDAGKATGIVTTTRITHASPSGTYAHIANRDWESDADVTQHKQDPNDCEDIASQLINNSPGKYFNVIFGGGRKKFLPIGEKDEDGQKGERLDGVNLINKWTKQNRRSGQYIYNKKGLEKLNFNETERVLGLFANNHLDYYLDADHEKQPTLGEMTVAAIKMLQKERRGYFLFVEGGRIDHGHHETKAQKALTETVQFSEAVRLATELTSAEDTLIVVTSDHAHTMSLAGYSKRGENVLGFNTEFSDIDKLPYTTLSYANGPGAVNGKRQNIKAEDLRNKDFLYPALVHTSSETHGGDDVAVFASGPWSHLFSGVYEQNTIPHLIAFASCIGDELTVCNRKK